MNFREALENTTSLVNAYRPGLQALKPADSERIECDDTRILSGSADVDAALSHTLPNAPRWDYAVGLRYDQNNDMVIWIEVHPASSTHNLTEVLDKLDWLKEWVTEFAPDLRRLTREYVWVATGKVTFPATSPERRRLARAGITWAGKRYKLIRE
jgi:hypothetical protein